MGKDVKIFFKIAVKELHSQNIQILPYNHCMTVKSQPPKSQEVQNVVTFPAYMTQKNMVTESRTLVNQV